MCGHGEKTAVNTPGKRPPKEMPWRRPGLSLPASRTRKKFFLLFKLPSLWYLILSAERSTIGPAPPVRRSRDPLSGSPAPSACTRQSRCVWVWWSGLGLGCSERGTKRNVRAVHKTGCGLIAALRYCATGTGISKGAAVPQPCRVH